VQHQVCVCVCVCVCVVVVVVVVVVDRGVVTAVRRFSRQIPTQPNPTQPMDRPNPCSCLISTRHCSRLLLSARPPLSSSVRDYVSYAFFGFRKSDFLRFFEITCQKVVKSRQQEANRPIEREHWTLSHTDSSEDEQ